MDQTKSGNFIAQLRKQQRLTQRQLAEQLHISPAAVCKWETGVNAPDLSSLESLADFFQVSVSELLAGEKNVLPTAEIDISSTTEPILSESEKTAPRKRLLKYILLSIAALLGLQVIIYLGIHYYNNRPLTYTIIKSYYCDPNPDHQEAYGVQKAYCAIVEYNGNLTNQYTFELDKKIVTEIISSQDIDVDIIYIEYYNNYYKNKTYDAISFSLLPLPEIDADMY